MRVSGPPLGITADTAIAIFLLISLQSEAWPTAWAARGKVRETVKYGADLIKICASGES